MGTLEERVAYLEGRVEEHSEHMNGIREALVHLEQRVDRRFESLESRLDARFQAVDVRFQSIDLRLDGMDRRLTGLDEKMTRYFVWGVGIMVTMLAAVVAAVAR